MRRNLVVKFGAFVPFVFAAAILAACGGTQNQFQPVGSSPTLQSPMIGADACAGKGGVRVTPCKVIFTASQPGPDTVSVRTPKGNKSTLVEHDNCGGASGKAVLTEETTDTWSVSAGALTGNCKAKFNYFNNNKRVGWAELIIENEI
jgi:hypothetical protein